MRTNASSKKRSGRLTCGPDCGALGSEVARQVPPLASGVVSWSPPDELGLL